MTADEFQTLKVNAKGKGGHHGGDEQAQGYGGATGNDHDNSGASYEGGSTKTDHSGHVY